MKGEASGAQIRIEFFAHLNRSGKLSVKEVFSREQVRGALHPEREVVAGKVR